MHVKASLLVITSLVLVNQMRLLLSETKTSTMDTLITTREMNSEPEQFSEVREEIATGPFEPYTLNCDSFNWN